MPEKMVSISDTLAGNPLIFGLILCCMFLLIIARVRQNGKFMFLILSFYRGKGIIEPQIMKQWFVDVNKKVIVLDYTNSFVCFLKLS